MTDEQSDLWNQLVEAHNKLAQWRTKYGQLNYAFLQSSLPRVAILREAIRNGAARDTILDVGHVLPIEERLELLPEWLEYVCSATYVPTIEQTRAIIYSLPRDRVLAVIEDLADQMLQLPYIDYWNYGRLFELYAGLEAHDLVQRLIHRAIQHPDPDIREVGEYKLERINEKL